MDIVQSFLERLFVDHCPCFEQQCLINGLVTSGPSYSIMTKNIPNKRKAAPSNCTLIFSSKNSEESAVLNADTMIKFYLDCMVDLGLLREPLDRVRERRHGFQRSRGLMGNFA